MRSRRREINVKRKVSGVGLITPDLWSLNYYLQFSTPKRSSRTRRSSLTFRLSMKQDPFAPGDQFPPM